MISNNYTYDLSGNPQKIYFTNGSITKYVYSATGQKLRMVHYTAVKDITRTIGQHVELKKAEIQSTDSTDYLLGGSLVVRNGKIDKYLFDGGYAQATASGTTDKFTFYYQNKDHLGTVRETVTSTGAMKQRVNYYPFGGQLVDTLKAMIWNRDFQQYKYNGKEFDNMYGLNTYDYGARQHYPILARWDRIDPLCEKYYGVSPYAYCGNNPVDRIDPDGLDWFIDVDGTYQYSPDVHSQDDLKKGQTYLWEERKVWNDNKKKECTYYRKDGSILYDNETAAYNRMWNQADRHYRQYNKGGREVGGFILSNGKVLVMPDYKNDATSSYISDYGYKLNKDGILSHGDESFEVLANIHTHQERTTDPSPSVNSRESDLGISKCMGGLPVITMGHDNKVYGIFHIKGGKGWRYSSFDLHSRTGLLKGSYTIYPWLKKTFKR